MFLTDNYPQDHTALQSSTTWSTANTYHMHGLFFSGKTNGKYRVITKEVCTFTDVLQVYYCSYKYNVAIIEWRNSKKLSSHFINVKCEHYLQYENIQAIQNTVPRFSQRVAINWLNGFTGSSCYKEAARCSGKVLDTPGTLTHCAFFSWVAILLW
jgi:hypothetical protein